MLGCRSPRAVLRPSPLSRCVVARTRSSTHHHQKGREALGLRSVLLCLFCWWVVVLRASAPRAPGGSRVLVRAVGCCCQPTRALAIALERTPGRFTRSPDVTAKAPGHSLEAGRFNGQGVRPSRTALRTLRAADDGRERDRPISEPGCPYESSLAACPSNSGATPGKDSVSGVAASGSDVDASPTPVASWLAARSRRLAAARSAMRSSCVRRRL
jgi:hypothetical protein